MSVSPQNLEDTLAALGQATNANLCTPGRTGCMVALTPASADEVMVTGDLHGNRENFQRILDVADLAHHPRRHVILQEVCHGGPTYPDGGGCMSHTLLEDVARLKTAYAEQVHFLLGNHELAELSGFPIQKNRRLLNAMFRLGLQQRYGADLERVRQAYFPFLRSCPLAVRLPGVFVSHSIPEHADSRAFDTSIFGRSPQQIELCAEPGVFDLVWGRDYRRENARAFANQLGVRVLICGHDPCPGGYAAPNPFQVVLDCCGPNACYVILPTDEEPSQAAILDRIRRLACPETFPARCHA
jgi:hypothetical protein